MQKTCKIQLMTFRSCFDHCNIVSVARIVRRRWDSEPVPVVRTPAQSHRHSTQVVARLELDECPGDLEGRQKP